MTIEELRRMAEMDIHAIDRAELVDIADVQIDTELPKEERIASYLEQVKNPYCYLSHGVKVKIGFAGKKKLSECLEKCISIQ